jgi:hypothetical protein
MMTATTDHWRFLASGVYLYKRSDAKAICDQLAAADLSDGTTIPGNPVAL